MENQSTATHEEHMKDPYSVLKATKAHSEATSELEGQSRELGKERDVLGSSIYTLEKALNDGSVKGELSRTRMQVILNQKKRDMKEVELNLDINQASQKSLTVSSFMGEGENVPTDYSKMSRKNLTTEMKTELMKKLSLKQYMAIPFN